MFGCFSTQPCTRELLKKAPQFCTPPNLNSRIWEVTLLFKLAKGVRAGYSLVVDFVGLSTGEAIPKPLPYRSLTTWAFGGQRTILEPSPPLPPESIAELPLDSTLLS